MTWLLFFTGHNGHFALQSEITGTRCWTLALSSEAAQNLPSLPFYKIRFQSSVSLLAGLHPGLGFLDHQWRTTWVYLKEQFGSLLQSRANFDTTELMTSSSWTLIAQVQLSSHQMMSVKRWRVLGFSLAWPQPQESGFGKQRANVLNAWIFLFTSDCIGF